MFLYKIIYENWIDFKILSMIQFYVRFKKCNKTLMIWVIHSGCNIYFNKELRKKNTEWTIINIAYNSKIKLRHVQCIDLVWWTFIIMKNP
jgi:hypothetical protein